MDSYWQDEAFQASLRDAAHEYTLRMESERVLADLGWIRFIEDEDELVLTSSRVEFAWPPVGGWQS